jgi:hypothetical protein
VIPGQVAPKRKKGGSMAKIGGMKKKISKAQAKENRRISEAKKAQRKAEVMCT